MSDDRLKQRTAKGLLWGGIGNGALQLLNLVFGIFLARLLSPSDYGVIGALTIFSAVAGLLCESGFILAIVNKKEVTDDDYNAVFWFNVIMAFTLYGALFLAAPLIARFYHTPAMTALSRVLFLSFLVGGLASAPAAYFFRNLMVKERSQIQIVAIVISGVTGVICAFNGMGYWGLAIQTVLYSGLNSLMMWIRCPWRPSFSFKMANLREMLPFSLKQLVTSLFTVINNNVFSVLLGRFYGMKLTGYYTQGNKWTTMGYSTLTGMINSVGQPVMREASDNVERLRRVFRKMLRFTAFVSFPAMLGLAIVAPELITITITSKWMASVGVMQILCVWGAFMPIGVLYGNLFNSQGRPDIFMWNTIALGVAQLLTLLASYRFGLNVMLVLFTTVNILWLLVWQTFAHRQVGLRLRDVLGDIAPYVLLATAVMAGTYFLAAPIANVYVSLVVKIVVAAAAYFGILWLAGSGMLREAVGYIRHKRIAEEEPTTPEC